MRLVQHEQRSAEVPVSLFGEWRPAPWNTRNDRDEVSRGLPRFARNRLGINLAMTILQQP
jgi:hypothetical protein